MTEPIEQTASIQSHGKWADIWAQFRHHKGALFGGVLLILIVAIVMLGPLFWHLEANTIDIRARNQGASWAHPLGTDQLGRDTFARLIAGGQTSISVGLTAMILSLFLGMHTRNGRGEAVGLTSTFRCHATPHANNI